MSQVITAAAISGNVDSERATPDWLSLPAELWVCITQAFGTDEKAYQNIVRLMRTCRQLGDVVKGVSSIWLPFIAPKYCDASALDPSTEDLYKYFTFLRHIGNLDRDLLRTLLKDDLIDARHAAEEAMPPNSDVQLHRCEGHLAHAVHQRLTEREVSAGLRCLLPRTS
eukprot:TRINITY_DN23445_c0_g1_i1.p1 TRINITY_DN23445_c0_g1~~TRINITY_DN23445_c0_g1_i1.p1  ORF type:complete len:168 (+),score=5.51 TRINITY_DN23445_c0_g1_i1:105-608(+)